MTTVLRNHRIMNKVNLESVAQFFVRTCTSFCGFSRRTPLLKQSLVRRKVTTNRPNSVIRMMQTLLSACVNGVNNDLTLPPPK